MKWKTTKISRIEQLGDILEIRIKDLGKNSFFKARANIHDKRRIKEILESLKAWNIDVREILNLPQKEKEKEKEKEEFWW